MSHIPMLALWEPVLMYVVLLFCTIHISNIRTSLGRPGAFELPYFNVATSDAVE